MKFEKMITEALKCFFGFIVTSREIKMRKLKIQIKLAEGFVNILSLLRQAREEGDYTYLEFGKEFKLLLDKYKWFHVRK